LFLDFLPPCLLLKRSALNVQLFYRSIVDGFIRQTAVRSLEDLQWRSSYLLGLIPEEFASHIEASQQGFSSPVSDEMGGSG
jgi:hypothetical protein